MWDSLTWEEAVHSQQLLNREERRRSVTQRTHQLDASRFKRWSNADPGEGIATVMTGPDLEIIGPGESNPPARSDEDSECRLLTFKRFRTFANFIITWTFLNFFDLYNKQFELYNWSATLLTRHYMMSQKSGHFYFHNNFGNSGPIIIIFHC